MLLAGKESNACVDFAQKMAEYTLQMQLKVFGPLLAKYYAEDNDNSQSGTVNGNIFDRLPASFTLHDLRMLKGNGFSDGALYTIISRWKSDGWVDKTGKSSWTKKK
jgi:DNA-binding transcriptional regulator PaaX